MKNISRSLVFILFAAGICSAQSVLYFPQFADGTQDGVVAWGTSITVTNPAPLGTPAASGTITFTQDDGAPVNVMLVDYYGAPAGNTFQLAGGQTKIFQSAFLGGGATNNTNPGPLEIGFATVTSTLPVTAGVGFVEASRNGIIGAAAVQAATPLTRQAIFFTKNDNTNTAVAVANPGTKSATITFQILDGSGTPIVPQVTRTLAAKNHTAFFVPDLFPSAPFEIWGTMRITSDQPIVSTALLFIPGGGFITTPVFPLP
jgi:hypothetical protein